MVSGRTWALQIAAGVALVTAFLWVSTQWAAAMLGYQAALGAPWVDHRKRRARSFCHPAGEQTRRCQRRLRDVGQLQWPGGRAKREWSWLIFSR
jgi:hypothetical protein